MRLLDKTIEKKDVKVFQNGVEITNEFQNNFSISSVGVIEVFGLNARPEYDIEFKVPVTMNYEYDNYVGQTVEATVVIKK